MVHEWYESSTGVAREWSASGTRVIREWCEWASGRVWHVSTSASSGFRSTTLPNKSKISRIVFGGFELDTPKATIESGTRAVRERYGGDTRVVREWYESGARMVREWYESRTRVV